LVDKNCLLLNFGKWNIPKHEAVSIQAPLTPDEQAFTEA
jgi:hypothetical protein